MKYGKSVDLRGGGRFSGRITAGFVMAGAVAKMLLELVNIKVAAYTRSVSDIRDDTEYSAAEITDSVENNSVRTVNSEMAIKMERQITEVKELKDSVGGIVTCLIEGVPPGVGDPIFSSLESRLAAAIFSIPGVRGIEFGLGFKATEITGSRHNDPYSIKNGKIITTSNNAGGIIGGISTGMPIKFNVAIKPTASIGIEQKTVNLDSGKPDKLKIEGRHDPCIVPRAVPVVEAITAVTLVDFLIGSGIISKTL
jgi:chorismate synthase